MTAAENKQFMQRIFDELAKGNGRPFVESLADDFRWVFTGTSSWSRTYEGKPVVVKELLEPLFAQFAGRYTNKAVRMIAEGDFVVVECRGQVTTKAGKPYNNQYCYVCRIANGKLAEITEYMDTHLAETVLKAPVPQFR